MKNVLVTGATGFIGIEVARQLSDLGLRPRLLVRRPLRAALLGSMEADPIHGDLMSQASLRRAVAGIDTVFHLGARASFESYRRLKPTIVEGSRSLMQAAIDAGVEQFVYASSLFVHGSQDRPIDAHTPPRPALGYGRAKLEAEAELARLAGDAGLTLASVRLPHVYGAHAALFEQVRRGFAIFPGAMRNRCGHLHVEDAARLLIEIARQRWAGSSVAADRDPVEWREFFAILRELDPRLRLVRLPKWLGYAGAIAAVPLLALRTGPTLYTTGTVTGFNSTCRSRPRRCGATWAFARAMRRCRPASRRSSTATSAFDGGIRSTIEARSPLRRSAARGQHGRRIPRALQRGSARTSGPVRRRRPTGRRSTGPIHPTAGCACSAARGGGWRRTSSATPTVRAAPP